MLVPPFSMERRVEARGGLPRYLFVRVTPLFAAA